MDGILAVFVCGLAYNGAAAGSEREAEVAAPASGAAALRRPLGLSWPDAAYLGWFGPIGVSALFYLTLEADRLALPADVLAAGALVVVGSTVAHGLTSTPGRVLHCRLSAARRPAPRP